jgi:hypothetical protein
VVRQQRVEAIKWVVWAREPTRQRRGERAPLAGRVGFVGQVDESGP